MQQSSESSARANRLAAILTLLQSCDYVAESASQYLLGDRGCWIVVTLLEAWKALCRLRLISHVAPGRLMSSFAPDDDAPRDDDWSTVLSRLGSSAGSALRQRAGSVRTNNGNGAQANGTANGHDAARRRAETLLRAGDALHVLQPIAYLVLIQATRPRRGLSTGGGLLAEWQRRLPWVAALALEAIGLQLSSAGLRQLQAARPPAAEQQPASSTFDNAREIQHRRQLLLLFLVRPAARAAAHRILAAGAGRRGGGGRLARWCAAALELVATLETSPWARYFRTVERRLDGSSPAEYSFSYLGRA